jgi:O-antigen ligase
MTGETGRPGFVDKIEKQMPVLFLIWLLLTVLGPHQDLYKIFFHGIVIPAILVLLFFGQARINWRDPLLLTALILAAYSSITTFFVGEGPLSDHIRAFRWGVETFFCLLAYYLWLPAVLARPLWWGRNFILLALLGAAGGFLLIVTGLHPEGRLTGLGALHNPIQASSILLIYLAIGHFLIFMRHASPDVPADKTAIWLLILSGVAVTIFVLMSQSRGPIIAMAIFLVYVGCWSLLRNSLLITGMVLLGAAGLVIGVLAAVYGLDHYHELLLLRGSSYRFDIWQGYLLYPPDSLIFGFGAGTDPAHTVVAKEFWIPSQLPVTHAHNIWLGTLVRNGIIGLGLLFIIAVLLLKNAFTGPGNHRKRAGLMMLLLLVFLLTLTGSHTLISSAKAIWLFGWLPLLFVWFFSSREPATDISSQ